MTNAFPTTWGATFTDGVARFRLWAPDCPALTLRLETGDIPMAAIGDGWFEHREAGVPSGAPYAFVLPDGFVVPDPAARAQIGAVHGPSKLVDPAAFTFKTEWAGRPWAETVIYELHIGTFTREGTFASAIARLPYLADLGITAVELMPVAQFGGRRGWGYDGVLLYAPHEAYGSPDDMKAFVDAAHAHGIQVFLDVVYNHFGPDGNYIGKYASKFFDPGRDTPWGAAIAYDEPAVRRFFIENPLTWLTEYNLDGLRFDAIDHIRDENRPHILEEMAREIRTRFDRPIHLHTEDERNVVHLHPYEAGRPTLFTAEWNDDYHNVIHPIATDESEGYYADFIDDTMQKLARALSEGFIFQGEPSKSHNGVPRGVPSACQPITAFVIFNQNHDQVGNRAFGERLIALADHDLLVALTAMLLLAPQTPLLFMGEEYGETNPFTFFTDFDGELAAAVRHGRRNEFAKFDAFIDPDTRNDIPDPNLAATFDASKLNWEAVKTPDGAKWHGLYKTLLAVRAAEIAPRLQNVPPRAGRVIRVAERLVEVAWRLGDGSTLVMAANLSPEPAGKGPEGRVIAAVSAGALAEGSALGPHGVVVALQP
ncbi:MAG: malto-oligosyltrehalose trehalohydrolase [Pseudomonadota bacterium]